MNIINPNDHSVIPIAGKPSRYPKAGDTCDVCRAPLHGNVLSMVAVKEKLTPQADGELAYTGPEFWPLTYYCGPGCAKAAPDDLAKLNCRMTEPGVSLVTPCGICGELTDRTHFATSMILDRVKVDGTDDDALTLFDFSVICPDCGKWAD